MPIVLPGRFPFRRDAVHTALIALVVAAIFAIIWFPIHFPDSMRYIGAATQLRVSPFAAGALPMLLRPLYLLIGPWVFFLLNGILLVWTAAAFSRVYFQRVHAVPIIAAILLSGAATMAAAIMMDIHTSFAVLALLVLARVRSYVAWIVLAIGLISHGSAIPILAIVAIGVAFFFRSRHPVAATALAILAGLGLMVLTTHLASGSTRLTPKNALLFLTSRMMGDVPESVVGFAKAHPSSAIAENLPAFQPFLDTPAGGQRASLLWGRDAAYVVIGYDRLSAEAADYILYSLRHHPLANLRAIALNGARFILNADTQTVHGTLAASRKVVEDMVGKYYPFHEGSMKKGLQYREQLAATFNAALAFWSFWIATIWSAGLIVLYMASRGVLDRDLYVAIPASMFCYCLANAYVIGTLSGVSSPRQQVRMMYVPILFMCLSLGPVAGAMWNAAKERRRQPDLQSHDPRRT